MTVGVTLPHPYSIRKFKETDLAGVVAINQNSLPENYTPGFFLELFKLYPEAFLVTESEGGVVGYVMSRIESGFSEMSRLKFTRKGHIISIAVLPEHRRRGVAYWIMNEVMKAMEGYNCSEVYLEVRDSNKPAIALYEKLGFNVNRKIPGYYLDGEAACLMCRKLPLTPPNPS